MTNQNFVRHILGAIGRIVSCTEGLSESGFMKNSLIQDGVTRNLETLGEASKKFRPPKETNF